MMSLDVIHYDPKLRGRLMLGLQAAICQIFDAGDWHEFGHRTGRHDFIVGHNRLLRSLSWGDPDYASCVFEVLGQMTKNDPLVFEVLFENNKIRAYLEQHEAQLMSELGFSTLHVRPTTAPSASEVVRQALHDADTLIATNGALSAVDRLHTALHGYLQFACSQARISVPAQASITALYKALRASHPRLQATGAHQQEVGRILSALATVLDSINTLRNHGSIAHANEDLLAGPEAQLTVNAVRTLFGYITEKLP